MDRPSVHGVGKLFLQVMSASSYGQGIRTHKERLGAPDEGAVEPFFPDPHDFLGNQQIHIYINLLDKMLVIS